MLITLLLLLLIKGELKYASVAKTNFIQVLLIIFCLYSLFDLFYLNIVYDRSIHFSDPSFYLDAVKHITSFSQLFSMREESSNTFYYLINYIYYNVYGNDFMISFVVRINNILLILYTYLLVSYYRIKVGLLDYAIMLNPFLLTIVARNVRDLYILLFIVLLLISFKVLPARKHYGKLLQIMSIFGLVLIRPICLVPLGIIWLMKYTKTHKKMGITCIFLSLVLIYISKDIIIGSIVGQFMSAAAYAEEDALEYMDLYEGAFSVQGFIPFALRALKAFFVLICTPHPINYFKHWHLTCDQTGFTDIYTGLDNIMIILGSVVSYLVIIPRIVSLCMDKESYRSETFMYGLIFAMIYTLAYLGITDIRNHYTTYVLLLLPLFRYEHDIKVSKTSKYITFALFMLICLSH